MFKITHEELEKAVINAILPLPFYDNDNPETRKQIGIITDLIYDDGKINFTGKLAKGIIIKGRCY